MNEVRDSPIREYKENVQKYLEKIRTLADVPQPPTTSVDFKKAEEIPSSISEPSSEI